jgi:asparagine synthetase B (glutamine-hydrolysing)
MIDKLLMRAIESTSTENEVAVLLSGGVDSVSVAFAAHRLGKKITGYTFYLKDQPTYDSQKALHIANTMGWDCKVIEVPTDNETVEASFLELAKKYNCIKKTHFECCYPFLFVYPRIELGEVLSGWAADGYYGLSKRACMHFKSPKSKFDEFRGDYFKDGSRAGYNWHKKIAEEHNKKFVTPYLTQEISDYFYTMDWFALNQPFQKHHVVEAFPEFEQVGGVKKHINLQLGSGIDKLFEEKVITNKKLNFNNRMRIMDVCRDWSNIQRQSTLEDFFS